MAVYQFGIEIARTQVADVIVRVEAPSEKLARIMAREEVDRRCASANTAGSMVKDAFVDWIESGKPERWSDSEEDYSDQVLYSPDIDLTDAGAK
jgi:hypothetical protein